MLYMNKAIPRSNVGWKETSLQRLHQNWGNIRNTCLYLNHGLTPSHLNTVIMLNHRFASSIFLLKYDMSESYFRHFISSTISFSNDGHKASTFTKFPPALLLFYSWSLISRSHVIWTSNRYLLFLDLSIWTSALDL